MSKIALVYRIWDKYNRRYLSDEEMKSTVINSMGKIAMLVNGVLNELPDKDQEPGRYLIEYGQRYYDKEDNEFLVYEGDRYMNEDGEKWIYHLPGMFDAYPSTPVANLGSSQFDKV